MGFSFLHDGVLCQRQREREGGKGEIVVYRTAAQSGPCHYIFVPCVPSGGQESRLSQPRPVLGDVSCLIR